MRFASVTRNSGGAPTKDFTNPRLSENLSLRPVFLSSISVNILGGTVSSRRRFRLPAGAGRGLKPIRHDGVGFIRETMDHQEGLGVTRQPQLLKRAAPMR